MNVVILQPSYIPWLGYFDQISRADIFIFYDDVQYDKRGWRNRNLIKTSRGRQWLSIPVHSAGAQQGIPTKDIRIDWSTNWANQHWKALTFSYAKAPYFRQYASFVETFYQRHDTLLADFTIDLTIALARELGISHTQFMRSSDIPGINSQKTDRLIQILTKIGATYYISGPSARDYIEQNKFETAGITLEYMVYDYPEYPQLHPPFDPRVTILDLLFMTGPHSSEFFAKKA